MKKSLFLLIALLPMLLFARPVSRNQAQQFAEEFLVQHGRNARVTKLSNVRKSQGKHTTTPPYYIFSYDEGIVVASGDDRLPLVLGYSTSNTLSPDGTMPAAMEGWLDEIEDLLNRIPESEDTEAASPRRQRFAQQPADRLPVEPIITAQWYQREPYNLTCPEYLETGLRSITGCVATAMAMAMSHYRYPAYTLAAIPKYTYTGDYEGVQTKITVPAMPKDLFIDWDNIVDFYDTLHPHTPVQDTAIANLMMYAGKAVKMQYTPSSSGAYSINVAPALKDCFGYPSSVIHQRRECFSSDEWDELIYNELANDRPVIYCGATSSSAHAYIVDGYESNGYYHVNWGWGGTYDGYFLLDVLNPRNYDRTAAVSTREGYVQSSVAVVGITTETVTPVPARLLMELHRNTADSLYYRSRNYTTCPTNFDIAIAQLDDEGEIVRVLDSIENVAYTNTSIKTHGFAINISTKGTYNVAFISRVSGTIDWIVSPNYNGNRALITLTVNKNGATVTEQPSQLAVVERNVESKFEVDSLVTVYATVRNTGMSAYCGTLYLHSIACDGYEHRVNPQSVYIGPGQTKVVPLGHSPRQWGGYRMYITTAQKFSEGIILDSLSLTIQPPTDGHGLSVVDYSISGRSDNGEIQNGRLQGSVTIRNTGTSGQSYPVAVSLMRKNSNGTYGVQASQLVNPDRSALAPQEQITYGFAFDNLQTDSIYTIQVVYDSLTAVRPLNGGFYQLFPLCRITEKYSAKYVAKVLTSDTTIYCKTLTSAFSVASKKTNPTIRLLKDIENIGSRLKYTSAVDNSVCTLDLNGHILSGELQYLLLLKATGKDNLFVVTDRSLGQTGKISSKAAYNGIVRTIYLYKGGLRIDAGIIDAANTSEYSPANSSIGAAPVYTRNHTAFELNNGMLVSVSQSKAFGVVNYGSMVINGGSMDVTATEKTAYGIYVGAASLACTPQAVIRGGHFIVKSPASPKMVNNAAATDALRIEGGCFNITGGLKKYLAPDADSRFYARKLTAGESDYLVGYRYRVEEAMVAVTNVANGTTTCYTSLNDAVLATRNLTTATIRLLTDITDIDSYVLFKQKKENSVITLDMNGHLLQGSASPLLYVKPAYASSRLVITDSSEEQSGIIRADCFINSSARTVYLYRGNLELQSGSIEIENDLDYSVENNKVKSIAVVARPQTQFVMTGGQIVSSVSDNAYGIFTYGSAYIEDGLIKVTATHKKAYGIYAKEDADNQEIIVTGGRFYISAPSGVAAIKTSSDQVQVVVEGGYYTSKTYLAQYTAPAVDNGYYVVRLVDADEEYQQGYRYTVRPANDGRMDAIARENVPTDIDVTSEDIVPDGIVRVYDLAGRLLLTQTVTDGMQSVMDGLQFRLPTGVYIIRIGNRQEKILIGK